MQALRHIMVQSLDCLDLPFRPYVLLSDAARSWAIVLGQRLLNGTLNHSMFASGQAAFGTTLTASNTKSRLDKVQHSWILVPADSHKLSELLVLQVLAVKGPKNSAPKAAQHSWILKFRTAMKLDCPTVDSTSPINPKRTL